MAKPFVRVLMILAVPTVILGGVAAWQGTVHWWNKGYSTGTRTGVLRKVSMKGTPLCRYASVEMVMQGSVALGAPTDGFEFTLDDSSEQNPLYQKLQEAERRGRPVTVQYRQDLHKWWWRDCVTTEYYATGIVVDDSAPPEPAKKALEPVAPAPSAPAPSAPAPSAPRPAAPTGGGMDPALAPVPTNAVPAPSAPAAPVPAAQ